MIDSDDDTPQLNPATLAALNEFYQEREKKLQSSLEQDQDSNVDFEENWQLSQFWYNKDTISTLTKVAVQCTAEHDRIALISCPSLYKQLKSISGERQVRIFEFDERFSAFGADYIFYDYNSPQNIPKDLAGNFDLVICDPPFLSEECLTKTAVTVELLAKNKIILCTGAVMNDLAEKLLSVKKCNFLPGHQNNLANEFWCYSNFDLDNYLK